MVGGRGKKAVGRTFSTGCPSPEAKVAALKPYGMESIKRLKAMQATKKCTRRKRQKHKKAERRGSRDVRGKPCESPWERGVWKEGRKLQKFGDGVDSQDYFGVVRSRWLDFFRGGVKVVLAANLLLAHMRPYRAEGSNSKRERLVDYSTFPML